MRFEFRVLLMVIVAAVCGLGVYVLLPPVAQDPAYHDFADKRAMQGVANFWNVAGNAAFLAVGLAGMIAALRWRAGVLWTVFFLGVFLTGFGSGYYHLAPENATLVFDRLPMTVAFMAMFSALVAERINRRIGGILAVLFLYLGAFSVVYWIMTENMGRGDLRPYALVQFLPMVLILLMQPLFPPKHGGNRHLYHALVWYVLAKLLENQDTQVFALTKGIMSGHALKHVAAAMGAGCMIWYMRAAKGKAAGG